MPSESPSTDPRQEFCVALKAARERKGITVQHIAASTKIAPHLLVALERNDLRGWPKGLFRRSFFRDYVRTIGLPVAETCDEFARLFPETEGPAVARSTAAAEARPAEDLRLVLDAAWHGQPAPLAVRLLAAGIDAAAVLLISAGLTALASPGFLACVAAVSLSYFLLATVLLGESPSKYALTRRAAILDVVTRALTRASGGQDAGTDEPVEEPPAREWITDARRVAAPRFRVRIKVSP